MRNKKEWSILLFNNGNIAVCKKEKQVPELQTAWLIDVLKRLQSQGVNIDDAEILLPSGDRFEETWPMTPTQFIYGNEPPKKGKRK